MRRRVQFGARLGCHALLAVAIGTASCGGQPAPRSSASEDASAEDAESGGTGGQGQPAEPEHRDASVPADSAVADSKVVDVPVADVAAATNQDAPADASERNPDARPVDAKPAADTHVADALANRVPGEIVVIDVESMGGKAVSAKNAPPNWYKPVDYHAGSVQVRVTTRKCDSPDPLRLELVFYSNDNKIHACLSCTKATDLIKVGDHTCSSSPQGGPGWYCYSPTQVDWSKPLAEFYIQGGLSNAASERLGKGIPKTTTFVYRYTAVLVPAGKKFSGWQNYP